MSERPILFSGMMVNAIRGGRKTQTRRIIHFRDAPNDPAIHNPWLCWRGGGPEALKPGDPEYQWQDGDDLLPCPFGAAGDRLWVRETFWQNQSGGVWGYRADGIEWPPSNCGGKAMPSIFMPRWASRLTLEVTAVRVERLQAITDDDCYAEGISAVGDALGNPRAPFRDLWDGINGKRAAWAESPWVWVVEFSVITGESK